MAMVDVTLSVEERLLESVRRDFEREGTTLNDQFRVWMEEMCHRRIQEHLAALRATRAFSFDSGGVKLTREEMNER